MVYKNMKSCLFIVPVVCLTFASGAFSFPWNFDMWIQPSIVPYEAPVVYPDLSVSVTGLRVKPLPREDFEKITASPVPDTEDSLATGEKLYDRFCYACHGPEGMGDGPVIKRGFYPLNLNSPGVIGRTDGYIYAYIRYGGKVMMPSYRESVTAEQAWDIVNDVMKLQGNPERPAAPAETTQEETPQDTAQEEASQDSQDTATAPDAEAGDNTEENAQ